MEIILNKKNFRNDYGFNKPLDTNPFKPKPMRPFGGRPTTEEAIKSKKLKGYIGMRKDGKYNLDFT